MPTLCHVASDSWPRAFTFGLANTREEVELSTAYRRRPIGWAGSTAPQQYGLQHDRVELDPEIHTEPPSTAGSEV
jgi:hypothetical protein